MTRYYPQKPPEERGFRKKTFQLRVSSTSFEGDAFDSDARVHGLTSVAYLRKLWNEDRQRRGLEPWNPTAANEMEPSE